MGSRMADEPHLPTELLIYIIHTVLADSFHTIFSVGHEEEVEWQLNVIATLSRTNSVFRHIVADSVRDLMDLKPPPTQEFRAREFLGDLLALGKQQRDPSIGPSSTADRAHRFLSTLLKGYQQFVLMIALRTMFHRLGKAKTDIIPLNALVDRVTAKMLSQLTRVRPRALAGPLRRMAETERRLSRILSRGTSASEVLPKLVDSYTDSPSSTCMQQLHNALRELEICTDEHVYVMHNYQYASTVVPFFRVLGIAEDAQSLDNLLAVRQAHSMCASNDLPADLPTEIVGPHALREATDLIARYDRLRERWDALDPGTALVCLPLPM
ncbi:hypothetical protein BD626DRAFT_518240 [Schizophyllum amplum]|uniref:Uncharacterized protein n=1 Tax=Schizophyllum amplum TaxID=97359 RepID=A0A550BVX5_9AGAR|nr:hypothetical protein BD626DRAFT_518240 [Auriculariopsis ampla]